MIRERTPVPRLFLPDDDLLTDFYLSLCDHLCPVMEIIKIGAKDDQSTRDKRPGTEDPKSVKGPRTSDY